MLVLGLSAFFHDSSAAIFKDGELIAAAQEERFSRIKFDGQFPENAIRYCLDEVGATPADLASIAYFEDSDQKLARVLEGSTSGGPSFRRIVAKRAFLPGAEATIRELMRYDGPIRSYSHHQSHAAHALGFCERDDAAIMVVDAVGEFRSASILAASRTGLVELFARNLPHSLGLFYSAITSFLGFSVNSDEYKVMGLAAYGKTTFVDKLAQFLQVGGTSVFSVNPMFLDLAGSRLDAAPLATLLGSEPRRRNQALSQCHLDIARSAQQLLEEAMVALAMRARDLVQSDHLCIGGGVALNCTANSRVRQNSGFKSISVPPGSGDSGSAIGAGRLACLDLQGAWPTRPAAGAYLGPRYPKDKIASLLRHAGIPFRTPTQEDLTREVAQLLERGMVVGWFEGRMEFGPRALGARSILADPRRAEMRDRLNSAIKKREGFRPFAPIALNAASQTLFADTRDCYMTFVTEARMSDAIPAAVHVDGTSRLQVLEPGKLPRLERLLQVFEQNTGIGCLLNTSFNVADEPIVCTPTDALSCFRESGLDVLVLEGHLILREECPRAARTAGARRFIEYSRELRSAPSSTYSLT